MSNWVLTKGMTNLLGQINRWDPGRDHASDGTIGDKAHQAETSGHNPDDTPGVKAEWNGDPDSIPEVRAIDVDSDFRNGFTAQQLVDHIVGLKPTSVLRYVIYNRRIWEASNGWKSRAYTGASAHTEHIHFSGAYTQASDENTTYDYRLEELDDVSQADVKAALDAFFVEGYQDAAKTQPTSRIGRDALNQGIPNPFAPGGTKTTAWQLLRDMATAVIQIKAQSAPAALAAQLKPMLPAGANITEDQLETAFVNALKKLAAEDDSGEDQA